MKTILAEKPSVARDIAKVLNCSKKEDGYISGNGYQITWAFGHLVEIAKPEEMNEKWAGQWSFERLPMLPDQWKFNITKDGSKQFNIIKKLFKGSDEIICATDAGREGEHIFRLIYMMSGCKKPIKRLWISSLTDESIKKGFNELKDGNQFKPLADSAMSRAKADWLVGLNFTQAYTVHNNQLCTVGRVQTPTLALIVNREAEINGFVKSFYYEIEAKLKEGFSARYVNEAGKHNVDEKNQAQRIYDEIKNAKTGTVKGVEKKTKKQKAPALYNLLGIQKDANKLYGITAANTLKLVQALYEKHKLVSYPRTESCHISTDMVDGLSEHIKGLPGQYKEFKDLALKRIGEGLNLGKAYVDDTKLTDHHAIIPTEKTYKPDDLNENEKNIYLLICERFLSIFLEKYVTEETKVNIDVEGKPFRAAGVREVSLGWRELKKHKLQGEALPEIREGQTVNIENMDLKEIERKPPKRFNEASLLSAMKSSGKKIEDKELAELIKENGLGTPATRAAIIERLIKSEYIERQKKNLLPTKKGIDLINIVEDILKSPETTALWEQKLKDIEDGNYSADDFNSAIENTVKEVLPMIKQSKAIESKRPNALGPCPKCKEGEIIEGKKGYGCNRYKDGCKFVIWKNAFNKKGGLPVSAVKDLLEKGETKKLKGFVNKAKKPYDAKLKLDDEFKLIPIFENNGNKGKNGSIGTCPLCGKGEIRPNAKAFGCSEWKNLNCKFTVWKNTKGKTVTDKQIKELVEKGQVKHGKAYIKIENKKIVIQ